MILWIAMALMTAIASLSIVVPLYRRRRASRSSDQLELSIFRDQLSEVDRDFARGLIGENEADAARTEISRRILRVGDATQQDSQRDPAPARRLAVAVALVGVPLAALGVYLSLGSPGLPDEPIAARLSAPAQEQDIAVLIARVEAHLASNPNDGRGWEIIAPVYIRLGRYKDAVSAFENAVRLLGPTAEREADLGEAITLASGNVVTPEARAAFKQAIALDAHAVMPRFYLAIALEQEGRTDDAITAWRELLRDAPKGAPWAIMAHESLARLGGLPAEGPEPVAEPGPSAGDVKAAATMKPEERMTMIRGMVDSLAARLEANPDDPEGWARLIRSYMVLGQTADASAALGKARDEFGGDPAKLAIVESEARQSGLIE